LALISDLRECGSLSPLQLIESLTSEIGTLKKEMGKKLGEEVGGLFLRASPRAGIRAVPAGARDSGYDSLRRRLSVLDRLMHTHAVWLQLGISHQDATRLLQSQPTGIFVVRKSTSLQRKVISLRMDKDSDLPVKDFPVKESQYTFSLEGSGLSFADLFRLVAFCCISRDVLPFTLKLPEAIASAKTSAELEEVAKLGTGFWTRTKDSASSSAAPIRPPVAPQRPVSSAPWLPVRTPSELECCQSNGALCFINPLFVKVHQRDTDGCPLSDPCGPREELVDNSPKTNNKDIDCSCADSLQVCSSDPCDSGQNSLQSTELQEDSSGQEPTAAGSSTRSPPPRPPPPRFAPRRSSPLPRHCSMPVKVPWFKPSKEKVEERDRASSSFSRLGSSLSISPSSSPPNRLSSSSPISIPRQEDAQCHLALQDQTIEEALMRAKIFQLNANRTPAQNSGSPPDPPLTGGEEEPIEESSGGNQRLSDMSISTDSSDSLNFSQSSSFFLPPIHDPSPPTDEEEADYGVSLESDQEQDQDLTMVPPSHRSKRRPSAGALVLLRKVSFVFNSLRTPEKRAIRRVVELSRDRRSYFGCLVQDYLGYMSEVAGTQAWQGYDSRLELLQTLRQFITQMKSYLVQSSELQPPIESLIPEEQIGRVLEKSMHKCVLKPLQAVVSAALQGFQVRSGEWRELKENLSLAKARQPQEMGVSYRPSLDPMAIEKMKQKFNKMITLYSPEKKVAKLLGVCKFIYAIMDDRSGRPFGADDFLPMLTYLLAQCDMPQLDNEILYMMELLDPALLHGEGGYYLTSAYGAMSLIRNFQEEQAAKALSSETRNTLRQWHQRRTTIQRSAPSIDDFQNYLRVALQELDSGCTAKTLQVRPSATVEDVCQLCALKFKVSGAECYSLFLVMGGSSQQLAPDTHPQKIKAELHSRPDVAPLFNGNPTTN
uniref:Uncharacterized protein n=1 Tax=Mola mola TaxID=94237 RepID=A0A3Q3W163_MOLML